MQIHAYLFFDGQAEEAIDFYRESLGARVEDLMRFKDNPEPSEEHQTPEGSAEKIMHATLKIGATSMFVSDGYCTGQSKFDGFALALTAPEDNEARRLFGVLSDGGKVQVPLAKTFFSSSFGVVCDRFGVTWMVLVAA